LLYRQSLTGRDRSAGALGGILPTPRPRHPQATTPPGHDTPRPRCFLSRAGSPPASALSDLVWRLPPCARPSPLHPDTPTTTEAFLPSHFRRSAAGDPAAGPGACRKPPVRYGGKWRGAGNLLSHAARRDVGSSSIAPRRGLRRSVRGRSSALRSRLLSAWRGNIVCITMCRARETMSRPGASFS
jgi:hypothetical protein